MGGADTNDRGYNYTPHFLRANIMIFFCPSTVMTFEKQFGWEYMVHVSVRGVVGGGATHLTLVVNEPSHVARHCGIHHVIIINSEHVTPDTLQDTSLSAH